MEKAHRTFEQRMADTTGSCERRVSDTAERSQSALNTIAEYTERRIFRLQFLTLLPAAAAAALIMSLALWALPNLMWPALERAALKQRGLAVTTGADGTEWLLFEEGTPVQFPDLPAGSRHGNSPEDVFFLISGTGG